MKKAKVLGFCVGTALLLCGVGLFIYGASAPTTKDLKDIGDTICSNLEEYRKTHGTYPTSLHEAGIESPHTRWGDYSYNPGTKLDSYILSVGDYEKYDYMLFKSSDSKEWTVYE